MDIRVSTDPAVDAAYWTARRLRGAVRRRGSASLALSGGSTAPALIDALVGFDVPWGAVTVWQVDERIAADGDAARNANQLADFPGRVRLMPVTSADLRAAARRYGGGLPDRLDVVHLGLGVDGHTASWPPGDRTPIDSDRTVEIVGPFNDHRRMTLTGRVVNSARSRVLLVVGQSKRPVIERWLLSDRELPVSALGRTNTWVFLDDAASPAAAALHPVGSASLSSST